MHWWDVVAGLSPLAVLIASAIAAILAVKALKQRSTADNRAEWWRRTQWALDHTLSDSKEAQLMGMQAAVVLASSDLAYTEEVRLFDAAWKSRPNVDEVPQNGDDGDDGARRQAQDG